VTAAQCSGRAYHNDNDNKQLTSNQFLQSVNFIYEASRLTEINTLTITSTFHNTSLPTETFNQGWENPEYFLVFWKETRFCSFLKKTEKPHPELFLFHHAISLFQELYNNNLLYLLWHSKLRVRKCTPSLCLQCVVGKFSFHWKLGSMVFKAL